MVYVAMHLSLGLEIYNAYKHDYYVTIFDCIRSVPDFIFEPGEIQSAFLKNLGFGYLFTFAGVFSSIKNMLSQHS